MTYWTYERDGEIFDAEFETQEKAQQYADDIFGEQCDDDGERGSCSEDITLIEFDYDDDGERVEKQRIPSAVEYEYYHGDFAEHSVWHKGGGGVL